MNLKSLSFLAALCLLYSCSKTTAGFAIADEECVAPVTINFQNTSKKADTFEWDFGDGSPVSTETFPSHKYQYSGTYTVKLKSSKAGKTSEFEKKILISPPHEKIVEIETPFGNMVVELSEATPKHRENFINLVKEGYFDGLLFHRVIDGFMVQGGDPDSRNAKAGQPLGSGGPGYTVPAEFVDSLVHVKGALAAARQGDQVNPEKRSSGSQFYIVHGKPLSKEELESIETRKGIRYTKEQREAYMTLGGTPFLDRDYTVFGRVIKGLEVIDKIAETETAPGDRPKKNVTMKMKIIK